MSRLSDSDAVVEVLEQHPPTLDDVARARMEKRLIEAAHPSRRRASSIAPSARRGRARWAAAGALAVAAAVALGYFALRAPEDVTRVARMQLHSGSTRQSGTIDPGSSLRTGPDEVAEILVEDSVVHLEPETEVRLDTLTVDRIELALVRGGVRVEFHPRAPGHEGMSVRTARATVEVVGTVFTVREIDGPDAGPSAAGASNTGASSAEVWSTEVSVSEGRVRVIPHGEDARLVGAGESTVVRRERQAELAPPVDSAPAPVEIAANEATPEARDEPVAPRPHVERQRLVDSAVQRLARARRLAADGQSGEAQALFRSAASAPDASPQTRAEAYTNLGDLLQRAREYDAAADAYARAHAQGAGHLSHFAIYALARMQDRRMHDAQAARVTYHRFLEASPGGPLVGQARQALCRLGETDLCAEAPAP